MFTLNQHYRSLDRSFEKNRMKLQFAACRLMFSNYRLSYIISMTFPIVKMLHNATLHLSCQGWHLRLILLLHCLHEFAIITFEYFGFDGSISIEFACKIALLRLKTFLEFDHFTPTVIPSPASSALQVFNFSITYHFYPYPSFLVLKPPS